MTIVIGVDGSSASEHALEWGLAEARLRGSSVRLVHGWTYALGGHAAVAERLELLAEASQMLLDRVVAQARAAAPDLDIIGVLVDRTPAAALLEAAADAALLVVGSRGHGSLSALILGSVADACIRHSPVPVTVIRPDASEHEGGAVVVGVDGSEGSLAALRWARGEARTRRALLTVLHAWSPPSSTELGALAGVDDGASELEARALLASALDATTTSGGPDPRSVMVGDDPGAALVDASRTASMLVVGARGRGGFSGLLLGSVSRRCVHSASCPVVVVPSRDS